MLAWLQVTQLGHVKDLATAFALCLGNRNASKQIYNISGALGPARAAAPCMHHTKHIAAAVNHSRVGRGCNDARGGAHHACQDDAQACVLSSCTYLVRTQCCLP